MGMVCETVHRIKVDRSDSVVGIWKGGRLGTFRDLRNGKTDFKTIIYGDKKMGTGKPSAQGGAVISIAETIKKAQTR